MKEVRIVILGGGGVGKSALTNQFVRHTFITTYDPTIEDTYRHAITIDSLPCAIEVLDTAGTEQFLALKELHIKGGHGFILAFSLTSLASVNELAPLREAILRIKETSGEAIPLVLVGNKSDLKRERQVPREVGTSLSKAWGDVPYYEASARKRVNVDEVFRDVVRQVRSKPGSEGLRSVGPGRERRQSNAFGEIEGEGGTASRLHRSRDKKCIVM